MAEADTVVGNRLQGLLETLVIELFERAGFDLEKDCVRADRLDLTGDFVRLLFLDFRWAMLHWLRQRRRNPAAAPLPTTAETARFFEQRSARSERLAQGLINRLHRWLVEIE